MFRHYSKGLIFSILACVAATSQANVIPVEDARQLAADFFHANSLERLASADALELVHTCRSGERPLYYVFNARDGKGFIIMSADDCTSPVLGYSKDNIYNAASVPPAMKWMMNGLESEIKKAPDLQKPMTAASRRMIIRRNSQSNAGKIELKTPQWRQEAPFNNLIPGKALAGCVGTAMAMIMKYHNFPQHGTGSYNGVNFDVTYDWDNMRMDNYRNGYSQTEADAVATLIYHAGASIGTQFGYSGSSAYEVKVPAALINYFSYDPGVSFKKRSETSTQAEFDLIVENEIKAGRPVLYCGQDVTAGHAFVVDGIDPSNGMIHVNWGWGGADGNNNGGWYASTALNPTVSQSHSFNNLTTIIYNIKPGNGSNSAWSPIHITADGRQIGMSSDLDGDLTSDRNFTVRVGNLKNVSYEKFSGKITVALFGADGTFKSSLSKIDGFTLGGMEIFGSTYADFSCHLPAGIVVAEGDVIRMATSTDGGTTWLPVAGELITYSEIPATKATPNYFDINYPKSLTDATFTGEDKVIRGWNYNFKVVPSHPERDVVTVKNNGYLLSPDANNNYTIRNVLEEQQIDIYVQNAADVKEKRSLWVGEPGTLETIISAADAGTIKDLTLYGTIDARDFTFMRSSMKLSRLDLSAVRVAANGANQANAIPREAFRNLWGLKEVILPRSINRLNNGAFRYCGITSIVIPAAVTTYEYNVFNGSSALRDIWVLNPNPAFVNWCVFYGTPKNRTVHCPNSGSANTYKNNKYWNQPDIDAGVTFTSPDSDGNPFPVVSDYAFAVMENDEVKFVCDTDPGRYDSEKTITFTAEHIADNDNRMDVYANSTLLKPNAQGEYTVSVNSNTIIHFTLTPPLELAAYESPWKLTDTGGTIGLLTDVVNVIPGVKFSIRANSFATSENAVFWAAVLTAADGRIKEFISPVSTWNGGAATGLRMTINCCVNEASVREGNYIRLATSYNSKTWALVNGSNENVVDRLPALNNQTPVYNFTFPENLSEKANLSGIVTSAVRGRDLSFRITPKSASDVITMLVNGVPYAKEAKSVNYSFIANEDLDFDVRVISPDQTEAVVFDLQPGEHLWDSKDKELQTARINALKPRVIVKGDIDYSDFELFRQLTAWKTVISLDLSQSNIVADRANPNSYPANEFPPNAFCSSTYVGTPVIKLKDLKFPESVRRIGASALANCSAITELSIPLNLYNDETVNIKGKDKPHQGGLRRDCFKGCTSLTTIYCYCTPAEGNKVHLIDFNSSTGSGNNPKYYPNNLGLDDPSAVTVVVKPEHFTAYKTPHGDAEDLTYDGWYNGWAYHNFNITYEYPVYGINYDVTRCFTKNQKLNLKEVVSFLGNNAHNNTLDFSGEVFVAAKTDFEGRPENADEYKAGQKVKVYDNGKLIPDDKIASDGSLSITYYNPNDINNVNLSGNHTLNVVYLYDVTFHCASKDLVIVPEIHNDEEETGDTATAFELFNYYNATAPVLENVKEESSVRFKVNIKNLDSKKLAAMVKVGENLLSPDESGYYTVNVSDDNIDVNVYTVPRNGATLNADDILSINASEAVDVTSIAFSGDIDPEKLKQAISDFPSLEELDMSELTVALPAEALSGKESLKTVTLPRSTDIEDGTFKGCVNLTNVSVPDCVNYIGSNAFDGCSSLVNISFAGIDGIGANAFAGCDNLTSILFNTQRNDSPATIRKKSRAAAGFSADAFKGLNPNCLIYLDENETIPEGILANFIKVSTTGSGDDMKRVYQAVGDISLDAAYPFNALNTFSIPEGNKISIDMDLLSSDGKSSWSPMVLPFAPSKVIDANGKEMIIYDHSEAIPTPGSNYMAATLNSTGSGLELVGEIKANTPYVAGRHIMTSGGTTTFIGENATVNQTPEDIRVKGENYELVGTYNNRLLSAATTYRLNDSGSAFTAGNEDAETTVAVAPFSVYVDAPENSATIEINIPIVDESSAIEDITSERAGLRITRNGGIINIHSDSACEVKVFGVDGILVKVLHLQTGDNTVDGIPAGIYILNGMKVVL